jgi:hypothetical protein
MKHLLTLCIVLIGSFSNLNAQDFEDLDKSPMDAVIARNDNNSPLARIIYSRPQKKGREIFGELVPYGDVWRTGANEATEITFYENVMLNGQKVEAGTYSLFTIPEKEQWTIIVNSAINLWGAYNYDKSKNVLTTKVKSNRTAATVESFSITFRPTSEGANLLMGWDDTYVEVPITK